MTVDREKLRRALEARRGKQEPELIPWKAIALGLAVALVAVIAAAWWIWPRGETGPSENVSFDYQMWFYYYGSEENVPLENIRLGWSAPKVDNSLPELLEGSWTTWELYYIEDDNTLTLQASMSGIYNLRGARTSPPEMYEFGWSDSEDGPVLSVRFDRLYPREVFVRLGREIYDKENADRVTLKVYEQADSLAGWWAFGQEDQRIDFLFWAGLWRENVLVEQFQWAQENMTSARYWLWPVT